MFERLALYARTAQYLKPRQWLYFTLRKVQSTQPARRVGALPLDTDRFVKLRGTAAGLRGKLLSGAPERAEGVLRHRFEFLNHAESLHSIDWNREYVSPLWTYNLHYFDYVTDLCQTFVATKDRRYVERIEFLIADWIRATNRGKGQAWDPYPTSIRVVNWIFALLILDDVLRADVRALMVESLSRQLAHIERRLEWHLLANHLQKNLVALFLGGMLFRGSAPARWRSNASRLLWREIKLQVLPDGVHAERSPMYHAIAFRDLVEVVALARAAGEAVPADVLQRLEQMGAATKFLARDNTVLHAINDSASGVALTVSDLEHLANQVLGIRFSSYEGPWALADGGFYGVADRNSGDSLIIDCGNPGPAYQPGHSHCGILSYELDIAGVPVVVDSGVHGYDGDEFREYVRSTRAHNTVAIDGKDQSEMWGTFRVGRRARVLTAAQHGDTAHYVFDGSYRPYHDADCIHRRTLRKSRNTLEVTDVVSGSGQRLESFVHFHPDVTVAADGESFELRLSGARMRLEPFGVDSAAIHCAGGNPVQAWYCPEFGKAIAQTVIALQVNRNEGSPFGYRINVVLRG